MIVRGAVTHVHTTTITTKRGTTQLTALRVLDDHSRMQHGGQPGKSPSPTRYEVQFVDSKLYEWSEAIAAEFAPGDEVLVYADDSVRVTTSASGEATLVVHGVDLGHATLPLARRSQ